MKKCYTSVLLPIKKEYVDKIISGEKGIEFRKSKFKEPIEKVFIYESGTNKKNKIVGMFEIEKIVSDTPENLYNKYKEIAGISKEKYLEYFKNKDIAYGYIIKNFKQYFLNPNNYFNNFKAPQNYMYVDNSFHFLTIFFLYEEAEKYGMSPEHEFVQDLVSLIREIDPKDIEVVYYDNNWAIKDTNTNEVLIDEELLEELAMK